MRRLLLCTALFTVYASTAQAAPVVREASGADAASIQAAVDQFRTDLGTLNPNNGTAPETGRREINWDGVPDGSASPNAFPPNFFNVNSPRGVVFSTPGSGFQVSSTAASGVPVRFGNIDPSYTSTFSTFSAQRLFTPIGATTTDVAFFVPTASSTDKALTRAFGAVFTDVDTAGAARLDLLDTAGNVIFSRNVPIAGGTAGLSFLGVSLPDGERGIATARIVTGAAPLAAGTTDASADVVALDDFLYGEPSTDGDGVLTASDNCPADFNPDGANADGDAQGDACDADDDNDGLTDVAEAGLGSDPKKADTDADGLTDNADNCLLIANANQADGDRDGIGDSCDDPTLRTLRIKAVKKGFKISFRLSEPAKVRFRVEKKRGSAFKRLRPDFSKNGKSGANSFTFSGKLKGKKIGPGTYRLVAVGTDASKEKTKTVRRGFKVKRP